MLQRTALLLAVATLGLPVHSQEVEGIVEGRGFSRVKIAVPAPVLDASDPGAAEAVARTVRDDLKFSGFFRVVRPELYDLVDGRDPAEVPHDEWMGIGADAVVVSRLASSGQRFDLFAWLYDNPSRTRLFSHRYAGGSDLLRRIAHQMADDIVRQYTGRPGIALTRIAFVSRHDSSSEIYLMDYDGRRVRRLTTTGTLNLSPVWSPDGERLAFVSWRENRPDVYVMDSTGAIDKLPVVPGELNAAPDWSPDGSRIAYSSDVDGNTEIYLLDLATGTNTRLTRTPSIETAPAFSPNGREIAFTSDRSGTPQIYVMDTEGLNVRRLSFEGSYNESAAWSPRGDRLAYVSRIEGRFDVVVMDVRSFAVRRLTRGDGNSENPRWSPDGRHLVFSSNRTGTYDIYTMAADGSGVRRLTRGVNSHTPDWSR